MTTTMAIDQFGNAWHDLGPFPRKELLERLCATRAEKMYCDTVKGDVRHTGYIIRGHWLTVYTVTDWTKGKTA